MDDLVFKDQKIVSVEMEKEVKKSFIEYSMSVIMARALPDVRDGLKPVHRRILYAMYEDRLTYDKPFHKSAATVGNVLGRYHPHGDTAVYDTMVRMAQTFSLRYPLVEGQGNFGNVDGDQAAAYRYTEARLSRLSNEMMSDIDKNVIDFIPNFDNKLKEPSVLPSRFPNLLVNGSVGIAVGMATNIPPHNLNEVIDATILMIDNPDATVPELMEHIKGPDFPTSATIYGTAGIVQAYMTGRGRVMVRARAEIEEDKRRIIITEIPYLVNKSTLVENMADCVKDKRIEGITEIRDESGRAGMRIVVEYRRDAVPQIILNLLYKYTQMQDTCAFNMLALVDKVPKLLPLRDILSLYIKHQEEVVIRRAQFELEKARNEAHISEGFGFAIDNIDEVIRVIRQSPSIPEAKKNLIESFSASQVNNFLTRAGATHESESGGLSDIQAQAIVEMPLGRLAGLERQKIEDRLSKLYELITSLEETLASEGRQKEIIKEDLLEIKRRFGDARRTDILPAEDDILLEDLIEKHNCLITMTHAGYIKRRAADSISSQRRGGKGMIGMATKDEDYVEMVISAFSHSDLLLFTNTGKVHTMRAYQVPEASRISKGSNIVNLLELEPGDKITAMITVANYDEGGFLTMITKQGKVKRSDIKAYEYKRRGGKIAMTLAEGDELIYARHTTGDDDVVIATENGQLIRFKETEAAERGRTAGTIRGIRLNSGDIVVGAAIVEEDKSLLTITENGYGKRCEFDNYTNQYRGGKGVRCHAINSKTGKLAGILAVEENDDIMLITDDGVVIRTPVTHVPVYGRNAGGVIIMRLNDDSKIVNFAKIEADDDEDNGE